jgi:4-hydroxybenzoyl-CoA reductase subunit beta
MSTLAGFELRRAGTVAEAVDWLAATPEARPIAGGTDLLVNLRHGVGAPRVLVDISGLPGFDAIDIDGSRARLGAGVTIAALARDPRIAALVPAIAQAAASVAGPAHRNVATLGGNLCVDTRCVYFNQSEWWRRSNGYCLKRGGDTCHVAPQGGRCHAAYAGDLAAALIACGAQAEVAGRDGVRTLALEDLYRDDGLAHLALAGGDLVTAVVVPSQPRGSRSGYRKARIRGAVDFPLAGVAARLALEGGRVATLDVALTGTNSRPFPLAGTDDLRGHPVDELLLATLGKAVQKQASPMRTTLTQANWRRQVAVAMAQRLVRELAEAP